MIDSLTRVFERGDMQMICEAYDLMRKLLRMKAPEIAAVFKKWNTGVLDSFLIEITGEVLAQKDPATGSDLVDMILDTAGQKGTGKWTSVSALDMGVRAPTVAEAVFARCISAIKDERVAASRVLGGPEPAFDGDRAELIEALHAALCCSKVCSYAQGFHLMREAQNEYAWTLDFGGIAQIFRGGCIIRAVFLHKITEAFERDGRLANLLLDPFLLEGNAPSLPKMRTTHRGRAPSRLRKGGWLHEWRGDCCRGQARLDDNPTRRRRSHAAWYGAGSVSRIPCGAPRADGGSAHRADSTVCYASVHRCKIVPRNRGSRPCTWQTP